MPTLQQLGLDLGLLDPVPAEPLRIDRAWRELAIPTKIEHALNMGAALAINVSGGKDSDCMFRELVRLHRERDYRGDLFALHADLGEADWPESLPHVEQLCRELDVELIVVRWSGGDLIDCIERRRNSMDAEGRGDKPFWPSAGARYCTKTMKTQPSNLVFRRFSHIVSAEGLRAEESPDRAKKPVWEPRPDVHCTIRHAYNWRPIHHFTLEEVWDSCGTSAAELKRRRELHRLGRTEEALAGWPCHPCYVYGNDRCSCVFCVLGSKNDLMVGARHHPQLLNKLVQIERPGSTFKHNWSLRELQSQQGGRHG